MVNCELRFDAEFRSER